MPSWKLWKVFRVLNSWATHLSSRKGGPLSTVSMTTKAPNFGRTLLFSLTALCLAQPWSHMWLCSTSPHWLAGWMDELLVVMKVQITCRPEETNAFVKKKNNSLASVLIEYCRSAQKDIAI